MKNRNKVLFAVLAVVVVAAITVILIAASQKKDNFSKSAQQKTLLLYTSADYSFNKPENEEYECAVTANDSKYVSVDACNEDDLYWLTVKAKKPTDKEKPIITVFKNAGGKKEIIKEFQITVEPVHTVGMADVNINEGVENEIKLQNPYEKEYRFEYDKKVLDIRQILYDGDLEYHCFIGLKQGKTEVKAYLTGTDILIGSFTVTVGDYDAEIKDEYKNAKISFNRHIDSSLLLGGSLDLSEVIGNYHANSVYVAEIENPEIAYAKSVSLDGTYTKVASKFDRILSKKTGKTAVTVYEERGGKRRKIGKINLTVNRAEDREVYESYLEYDNDGIFYENFMTVGDSFDLKSAVTGRYLNFGDKKYRFKENEYVFTAKSARPDIVSVDKNGVCTCLSLYRADDKGASPEITYRIKFADGSEVSGGGAFDLVDKDFFN